MRVVNFSEARNNLKTVLDQVVEDADYTVITRRDADDTVVMSLDTFTSYMETVHLLKSPANAAHLAESIEQYQRFFKRGPGCIFWKEQYTVSKSLDINGLSLETKLLWQTHCLASPILKQLRFFIAHARNI